MRHYKPTFYGIIRDGKLKIENMGGFMKYLNSLKGKRLSIKVREYKTVRSELQNRMWWGQIIPQFMEFCGYEDKQECHLALLEANKGFLEKRIRTLDGAEVLVRRGSSDLFTDEFSELVERCKRIAARMGMPLEVGNEPDWESIEN